MAVVSSCGIYQASACTHRNCKISSGVRFGLYLPSPIDSAISRTVTEARASASGAHRRIKRVKKNGLTHNSEMVET
eukprot:6181276-Pleurochrysis_carterae.AAC.1